MITILFDLDGTLVDTAPDLAQALNLQLKRHSKAQLPYESIRPFASHGSRGLVGLGFGITPQDDNFIAMRDEYLSIYDTVYTRSPKLLPGIADLLQAIENKGLTWGIVTNKPRRFTIGLIESLHLNLENRAACIICGDDAPQPKPSPATLLMACEKIGVKPENCIYVGDAERDVQAGKAAGMQTVVALFGYIDVSDKPTEWGADAMILQPKHLLKHINLSLSASESS
jgi:N-acetyl-D-muramate 6-phosphate phosphatase